MEKDTSSNEKYFRAVAGEFARLTETDPEAMISTFQGRPGDLTAYWNSRDKVARWYFPVAVPMMVAGMGVLGQSGELIYNTVNDPSAALSDPNLYESKMIAADIVFVAALAAFVCMVKKLRGIEGEVKKDFERRTAAAPHHVPVKR